MLNKFAMNRFLIIPFLCFAFSKAFSLSIIPNAFEGSVLCGDLSFSYVLPDSLQKGYDFDVDIQKVDSNSTLVLTYSFFENKNVELGKEIVTDLMPYFEGGLPLSYSDSWNVKVVVNEVSLLNYAVGFPYTDCVSFEDNCDYIKAYRKSVRSICPNSDIYTSFKSSMSGDSLFLSFIDSSVFREVTCLAYGNYVQIDSAKVELKMGRDFKVFSKNETTVYCFTIPCYPWVTLNYLGDLKKEDCVIDGFFSKKEEHHLIFPNPIVQHFSFSEAVEDIVLIDVLGQTFLFDKHRDIDVSHLPKGIYVVQFLLNGEQRKEKVVIK